MEYSEQVLFSSSGRSNYRIPSLIVTNSGTALAFCNNRMDTVDDHAAEKTLVSARKPAFGDWESIRTLASVPGWACSIGSAVYDENADTAMCTCSRIPVTTHEFRRLSDEERAAVERETADRVRKTGIAPGDFLLFSDDDGQTWKERPLEIEPYSFQRDDGAVLSVGGSCHGSAHGVTLRHGKHAGRLLMPSRVAVDEYHDFIEIRRASYNNSIYSDDHGLTWKASAPVQAGTGEGALMEDGSGVITYNSRAYYADQKRRLATSTDGGETYGDFRQDDFLIEEKAIGCNASLLRVERSELTDDSLLPEGIDSITLFINPRAAERTNLTACVSFDSGRTWTHTKRIHASRCAYSSLAFSKAEQRFMLLYECGEKNPYDTGIVFASFDLEWLLSQS